MTPFAEEAATSFADELRRAVHGLWAGQLSRDNFLNIFEDAIKRSFPLAWAEGMKDVGLLPEDMTDAERVKLNDEIMAQFAYTEGFADYILDHSREAGYKLADLQYRLSLWSNQYNRIRNLAKLTAQNDPPLTWVIGPTETHCDWCAWSNGRTYRASIWRKYGWEPQKHYGCLCFLSPADPNFAKLTPGRPKKYQGPTMD